MENKLKLKNMDLLKEIAEIKQLQLTQRLERLLTFMDDNILYDSLTKEDKENLRNEFTKEYWSLWISNIKVEDLEDIIDEAEKVFLDDSNWDGNKPKDSVKSEARELMGGF